MSMTREEAIALLNEQYEICKRIILFTTRRGCDGNSKRSFDPSYR